MVVSVDGFGDFASAAWGVGRGTAIEVEERVYFPHSLGIFYQAVTQFLGFPNYGDEYKVMGLAPYGQPSYLDAMRRIVLLEEGGGFRLNLDCFRHHREKIEYEWENGAPVVGPLYSPGLADLLGRRAGATSRWSSGTRTSRARCRRCTRRRSSICSMRCTRGTALDAVAIAGGCGNNSVANGKVTLMTPFREVYVQAAAGDAGGALGAACRCGTSRAARVAAR